jgi:RNA polymerase sigma-70 factor (ECF subfamily)
MENSMTIFEQVYETTIVALYRYAFGFLGNRSDAEDAVSESCLRVFRRYGNRTNAAELKALLFAATRNAAIDRLRKKRPLPLLHDCAAREEDPEAQDVRDLLSGLPADERELISLKYMSELSFREIGALTGINEHTVQSRIYAILDRMRSSYVKNDKGDGSR